ncbi:hypothetical protein [Neobacillus notoginsengisoli]|nr:hypothetical protein [Neobacillus notoginsengisoli]
MNWIVFLIIIIVAYMPIFYRINIRLRYLEDEVRRLREENERNFCE